MLLTTCTCLTLAAQPTRSLEDRVEGILARMDLDDKVGEMTQIAVDVLSVGEPYNLQKPNRLDPERMRRALVDLRVGSVLNVGGHAYTRDEWHKVIGSIQKMAVEEKKSGIPVLYGIDAIHGANYTMGATRFPQQIGQACSWDVEMAQTIGRITAYDARASWIPWNFSPVMDIGRDPRWPRFWETYGEDVLLARRLGEAYIKGLQGTNPADPYSVAACLKHFAGYSTPWTGKDRTPVNLSERAFREWVLPPFQQGVDAGALTVMVCSGELDGVPVHANKWLLQDVLRREMGFKGLAVSDWEDILYLVSRHKVAANYKEAIKLAVNAGIDMSMTPMDLEFPVLLKELVLEGEVPMARIDEAVRRILSVKLQLGLFDKPVPDQSTPFDQFAAPTRDAINLSAATASIVLLQNENNLLPLGPKTRIAVGGPNAHDLQPLNGGWSGTWQGNDPLYDNPGKFSIAQALLNKKGAAQVAVVPWDTADASRIGRLASAAAAADAVVLCLGERSYTEKPGDISDLSLPAEQIQLVHAVAQTGKPIVLILAQGRPRIVREVASEAKAVLLAPLPGDEGGPALADILFGDSEPGGRLAFTYPRYANDLLTYDHKYTEQISISMGRDAFQPQWAFGHGLSYTVFDYEELSLSTDILTDRTPLTVRVRVRNTGTRSGAEVVQLYVSDEVASITPSVRRLRGFEKITLNPGESRTVSFEITPEQLAFIGVDNRWVTEPGYFTLSVGGRSARFQYR